MKLYAFIDESGSPVLGDGDYYIIVAILVPEEFTFKNVIDLQDIQNEFASGGQLKSSRIGGDFSRRVKIIERISALNFSIVGICINKSTIRPESGLRFKTSMYKYCQRKLFTFIYRPMISIGVICDTYGSREFMNSFEEYLGRHFEENIFSTKEFQFSSPENSPMLQISDLIGGTIRRFINGDDTEEAFDIFKNKVCYFESWPTTVHVNRLEVMDSTLDREIAECAFKSILTVIESEVDPILKEFCSFLAFDCIGMGGFIYGDVILRHLKDNGLIDAGKNVDWLMQNVVSKLRDKGAIIVACLEGYKIPECQSDLIKFAEFVSSKTVPYLDRFQHIRDALYLGTAVKYDLADDFPSLKRMLRQ